MGVLKMLAAFLIAATGYLAGKVAKNSWHKREEQLAQLTWAMGFLATEMNCLLAPLPDLLEKLAQRLPSPVGEIFSRAGEAMAKGDGISAAEAWQYALEVTGPELCFLDEDLAFLKTLGTYLGASDLEDQLKRLGGLENQLEGQRQAASEAKGRQGKLVGFAWTAIAIVVVILFW